MGKDCPDSEPPNSGRGICTLVPPVVYVEAAFQSNVGWLAKALTLNPKHVDPGWTTCELSDFYVSSFWSLPNVGTNPRNFLCLFFLLTRY